MTKRRSPRTRQHEQIPDVPDHIKRLALFCKLREVDRAVFSRLPRGVFSNDVNRRVTQAEFDAAVAS